MRSDAKTSQASEVTYSMILKNLRSMMAIMSAMFAMIFMLFFDSILTVHLINDLNIDVNTAGKLQIIYYIIGYYFALICATYAISSPFVGCLTQVIPKHWLTFMAFLSASVALFMFGPSKVFNFPNKIALSALGLAILGGSCSLIFVPLLSEIIEGVREKEGIIDSGTINDKAVGVFNTAYAIGCIIGPILGGYLSMMTGFRTTCDVMAFCSLGYALIFMFTIIVP
jgi:MFS family permease